MITRRRAVWLVLLLLVCLMMAGIAVFAFEGVSASGLRRFGIAPETTVGKLIERIAPRKKAAVGNPIAPVRAANPAAPEAVAAPFATRTVSNGNDSGSNSLRNTIAAAVAVDRAITINGNGITVERNSGVTRLRLFYVSPAGNLTLNNLMLQNGTSLGGNGGTGGRAGGGAAGLGGAIFNEGILNIDRSTLTANTAQGGNGGNGTGTGSAGGSSYGGGVFNYNGEVKVVAATLSDNVVTGGTNGTPAPANLSDAAGGGIYNLGDGALARLTILSSILANTGGGSTDCVSGLINSGTVNVTNTASLIESNNDCGSPALSSDPNLEPLQDNGGLTFTHALLTGSQAIDAGSNSVTSSPYSLTTDQRGTGFPRNIGGTVDMGAFEFGIVCPTITLLPGSLPGGAFGVAYTTNLSASGGASPYSFAVTGSAIPTGLTLNRNGTWSGAPSATGTFNFTVTATDDNDCTGTQSYSVTIGPAATTTTINNAASLSSTPTVVGQSYTVTVSVTPAGMGTPTGTVTVSDGSATCTITLPATSCNLTSTTPGTKTITATYNGSAYFNGSANTASHTVNKANATTAITNAGALGTATFVGQAYGVAAGVSVTSPGAGMPTRTVTVSDGSQTCTITLPATSCNLTSTTAGAKTITATDNSDPNFNGSASSGVAHTVNAASTTTAITSDNPDPSTGGQAVTVNFTVTVNAPGGGTPTGNVVVTASGGGTLTNDSNGTLTAGAAGIKLSGGTVGVSPNTCTVSVNVTPTAAGPFVNLTSNVTSTNGGTGNTATATFLTNTAPTISSNTLTPQAGSNASSFTIATAVDPDQPVTTLGITINGNPTAASSNGVTVSGVTINANGSVTANIATTCAAASATFTLVVTDNENATGAGTLTINVQPTQPPVLSYASPQTAAFGGALTINPTAATDNGSIAGYQILSVVPALTTAPVINSSGVVSIANAGAPGAHLITVQATDNCGATTPASFTLNILCPAITLPPASLPNGTSSESYSQQLSANGGVSPYAFAVTGGGLPGGLLLSAAGLLSGTPNAPGTFNFTVQATDQNGCPGTKQYTVAVVCPTVTLSALPNGVAGVAYDQTVTASPADAYTYAVTLGSLPVGLTLNAATGAITGTPTTSGTYSFRITATGANCSGSQNYSMVIGCEISLPALPNATAGAAYSQSAAASPAGSYSYSLIQGSLPSGLTLNTQTGSLSGTPFITGSYSFTIRALAGTGCSVTRVYPLEVACPTITINPASLPAGNVGASYNQSLTTTPAGGNYSYAVVGQLPPGLTLNPATGILGGTPTAAGTFNFTITATGFGSCAGSKAYSLTISGGSGGCPTIALPDLPNGTPGQLYNSLVTATPSGSYNYILTSGSLPPGLTLYNSFGLVYGYPTTAGTFNFSVTATDGNNCTGSKNYSVVIGGSAVASLVFGDFDGDGQADLSVWRGQAGDWLTVNSGDGKLQISQWGASLDPYNDVMTPGDYDGDGKMDLAVFRRGIQMGQPGTGGQWLIKGSRDGAITSKVWGLGTDTPVAGDYDGDGKTDLAVWRGAETNWYILRSSDGAVQTVSWGTSSLGDVPVVADYDGDGKADVGVWRESEGRWHVQLSRDGLVMTQSHGQAGDKPIPAKLR